MPFRPDDEEMQSPELPNPVMLTKPPGNDGAGHDTPDAETEVTQSDDNAELGRKKRGNKLL
jgi:hypothetical protein